MPIRAGKGILKPKGGTDQVLTRVKLERTVRFLGNGICNLWCYQMVGPSGFFSGIGFTGSCGGLFWRKGYLASAR